MGPFDLFADQTLQDVMAVDILFGHSEKSVSHMWSLYRNFEFQTDDQNVTF
jgi:hypothetical protein